MGAMLVMLLIFAIMFLHIIVTAKVFGRKLSPVEDRTSLIMELPPYHKPRWGNLLRNTLVRAWDVFKKAFVVVVVVTSIFRGLSHSASGDLSESILYKFGTSIEPVTKFFGMGWQTFIAFVSSMVAKEAVLAFFSAEPAPSGMPGQTVLRMSASEQSLQRRFPSQKLWSLSLP